jgi:acyl-CoA synthetase (AMP-forming)/AMP-acid ligase II
VLGESDDEYGERVVAFVAPESGDPPTAAALDAYCRDRIAGFKVPRDYRFVAEIPREANGKTRRHLLREQWPTAPDGPVAVTRSENSGGPDGR